MRNQHALRVMHTAIGWAYAAPAFGAAAFAARVHAAFATLFVLWAHDMHMVQLIHRACLYGDTLAVVLAAMRWADTFKPLRTAAYRAAIGAAFAQIVVFNLLRPCGGIGGYAGKTQQKQRYNELQV